MLQPQSPLEYRHGETAHDLVCRACPATTFTRLACHKCRSNALCRYALGWPPYQPSVAWFLFCLKENSHDCYPTYCFTCKRRKHFRQYGAQEVCLLQLRLSAPETFLCALIIQPKTRDERHVLYPISIINMTLYGLEMLPVQNWEHAGRTNHNCTPNVTALLFLIWESSGFDSLYQLKDWNIL
jgi:hypothetical protein